MTKRHQRTGTGGRGLALARLAVALAIMLLAVLPHATLAAGHAMPATGHAGPHNAAAAEPTPCHEEAGRRDTTPVKAERGMPSCCILGCGLLAEAPALPVASDPAGWRSLVPVAVTVKPERTPEPAERPPRRRPA
ncbi:MAG: hypothetical protein B7Z40_05605 [Bosea sp. 12-68-7]|nr:MAG: hypothetical protein B7Z40_05605 [Bosea sp. 12-68-7]OYW98666.1 MAG: hypothetical protein B7Z14_14230 [Bosea sp. 32-68-6]